MQLNTKVKQVVSIVLNVLVWIFLIFSILVTVLVFASQNTPDGVPSLFGQSFVTVQSDSMDGQFKTGDLIIIEKVNETQALELGKNVANKSGEVITYRAPIDIDGDGQPGDLNTHRIVERRENEGGIVYFKTQGDNEAMCPNPDDYELRFTDVIGVWKGGKIAGLGGVIDFLRSSLGFLLCVVLPMVLFFLYEVYNLISIIVKDRMKKASATVSAEAEDEIKRRAIEEYLAQQAQNNSAKQNSDTTDENS